MIRQQFATALSISIRLALTLTMAFFSYRIVKKETEWSIDNDGQCFIGWVLSIVSTVGSGILITVFLTHALARFINPAYYALMELVKLRP